MNKARDVEAKFSAYPSRVQPKMRHLRKLMLGLENEVGDITETLKWGEPAYQTKRGSTVRFDWKAKAPECFSIYFICTTQLIETFEEVYGDTFMYEGNRALVFPLQGRLPVKPLKHCLTVALRYHDVKRLPLLGM